MKWASASMSCFTLIIIDTAFIQSFMSLIFTESSGIQNLSLHIPIREVTNNENLQVQFKNEVWNKHVIKMGICYN